VGGLTTLVDDGHTGFLVEDGSPASYAAAVRRMFDEPLAAERFSTASVLRARRYTWRAAAHTLVELHDELAAGQLVECS
jgi:D-inositol-3-phosphate glycosyltransferase